MNKKFIKAVAGVCLAGALCSSAFALSACNTSTEVVEGDYHYVVNYGTEITYGVKVNVEIQTDEKGDRIRSVTIADSEYDQLSDANPSIGWTDESRQNYLDNEQSLLNAYRGMYVADVLALDVVTDATGVPSSVPDDSLLISGATQSSGRLLLAVQDALCNFGYSVFEGEYHYPNAWDSTAPDYGIRVRVVMRGNVVRKVAIIDSDYTEASDSNSNAGWDQNTWNNNVETLLNSYVGRTRSQILNQIVTVSAGGQPESVSDSAYITTGATQGSGRLLLAIQNALDPNGTDTTKIYQGEYSYEIASWGVTYGIKVAVKVKGDTILSVSVLDSEYTEVSDNWDGKDIWNNGISGLLSKYAGKTVQEVLSVDVTVNDDDFKGQPESVSDSNFVITGATQGSGRLLLAVQNALSILNICPGGGSGETPEEPGKFDGWEYTQYIDDATEVTANADGSVTYNIVTTANSPAGAFELTITVANGEITVYTIDEDGSTYGYGSQMSAYAKNMVGYTLEELKEQLEAGLGTPNDINTGATRSDELCVYSGLFALANFEKASETTSD